MKIMILQSDEEFVAKYGEFIHEKISENYDRIKEAVEFLTRMKTQHNANDGMTVTFYLDTFPEDKFDSHFNLNVEFNEKITFWLRHNDEEPSILDIEGFSCWNEEDEKRMYEIRKKYEAEHGGPDLLYP